MTAPPSFATELADVDSMPFWERWLVRQTRRRPMFLLVLILLSNIVGSIFNILYNRFLIVNRLLDPAQTAVFENLALPLYNLIVYPVGLSVAGWLLLPIQRSQHLALRQQTLAPDLLTLCQRRLVNMPLYLVGINAAGWLPGVVLFPLLICTLGGSQNAASIWLQFGVSFVVSALLTTAGTFFFIETVIMRSLYPLYFQHTRPAQVPGALQVSYGRRLGLLWAAVSCAPIVSLLVVALNIDDTYLRIFALVTGALGVLSGGFIFRFVGNDLLRWLHTHALATERIAQGDLAVQIGAKRPDEWGKLSDSFNDMATALQRAAYERETFGQIVGPEVRDGILQRYTGLGGDVREITVLFADIRGFTRRSAGEHPERVVALLNRFFSLAVAAVELKGGVVNKFLGDGVMALFGAHQELTSTDHADIAIAAALDLLQRLQGLNAELRAQQQEPLCIGVGIHTGPALTGCIGALVRTSSGVEQLRREFTAIGETVNLGQRMEQLTKTCGGPILLSAATRERLLIGVPLRALGEQVIPGWSGSISVFQVIVDEPQ